MAPSTWEAGTITTPGSAGSVAYSPGFGGRTPKMLVFFGTNWTAEDSVITSSGACMFRGMCAPQYNAPGTLLQNSAAITVTPAGNAHRIANNAITALTSAGGTAIQYNASVTSLDVDGFTLNWINTTAAHKVVWVALFDVANIGAFVGTTGGSFALGFKAGASLLHGAWAGPSISGTDRTQEFYGGAAYPTIASANWAAAGLCAFCFPTSSSGQYLNEITNLAPTTKVVAGGHFIGAFLVSANIRAFPSGGGLTNFTFDGDVNDGGMVAAWDDEDSQTGRLTPAAAQGDTTTVSSLSFAPGLLITYTMSDEPPGQGTGSRGAAGMSVVTPDFQWCATIDGRPAANQAAFQSYQRGFADRVDNTGVHAGTVVLTDDGFVMTTEEDDLAPVSTVWHAFGHPDEDVIWLPHIYRRILG